MLSALRDESRGGRLLYEARRLDIGPGIATGAPPMRARSRRGRAGGARESDDGRRVCSGSRAWNAAGGRLDAVFAERSLPWTAFDADRAQAIVSSRLPRMARGRPLIDFELIDTRRVFMANADLDAVAARPQLDRAHEQEIASITGGGGVSRRILRTSLVLRAHYE